MKTTKRVFILVKAYPQPSFAYEETVCCAGITDTGEFIRLYPIRYRRLAQASRFDRFDLIEVEGERPRDDHRPESFHVDEDSIQILKRAKEFSPEARARLWLDQVAPDLDTLRMCNQDGNVSLGIVRPEPATLRFAWVSPERLGAQNRSISGALAHQSSLIERPLKPLQAPEFAFTYAYRSGARSSKGQIHDWEVQAAYLAYKRRYREKALAMLKQQYQHEMARHNLHLFLGTMKAHPRQFIIVGLLRTSADLSAARVQGSLGI